MEMQATLAANSNIAGSPATVQFIPSISLKIMAISRQTERSTAPLNWTTLLFFGSVHVAAVALAPAFWSWSALGVTLFLHWFVGSIGICLAYHRLLTHRSFQVPQWLEYILATIGALAMEGGPIFWVAGHRKHHLHTEDPELDPYSAKRGFWWSHMGWILQPQGSVFDQAKNLRWAPDLAKSAYYRWLDRYFLWLQLPLAAVLYLGGGWSWVVYGILVRSVLLWHSTWLINSMNHMQGYRSFQTADNSRNLWWVALLTYGEGWHNNHHAEPNVAPAGRAWWEVDMTWWVIKLLRRMGLARRVVLPKE
jgi:sn-2 palmitoyl-lipid 9-desaturase